MPKFPDDFVYIDYMVNVETVQREIDEYITRLKFEDIIEIGSGDVKVTKYGDQYYVDIVPGRWILKSGGE
jgi:hypothetical protein